MANFVCVVWFCFVCLGFFWVFFFGGGGDGGVLFCFGFGFLK